MTVAQTGELAAYRQKAMMACLSFVGLSSFAFTYCLKYIEEAL